MWFTIGMPTKTKGDWDSQGWLRMFGGNHFR